MSINRTHRVLAVEIRAGRFGYAVFETPGKLRDFGASGFGSTSVARLRIARLLALVQPSVVVLRGASVRYRQRDRRRGPIVRITRDESRKRKVPVVRIPEQKLNSFFERLGCHDKYAVAILISKSFPEMSWRLPVRAKLYEPEPRALLYFDSVALGIAYLDMNMSEHDAHGDGGILSPASR